MAAQMGRTGGEMNFPLELYQTPQRASSSRLRYCLCHLWFLLTGILIAATPIIPSDSIRPGMKGYGLSVFSGYKIEKFDVEVIDVMPKVFPIGDLILARLSGQGLEQTGIIAGMSGSPVYLEGKLAGAVAYGWNFSKEPIAGITPVQMMLDIWNNPPGKTGSGLELRSSPSPDGITPLVVPLALSGYTPALGELVKPTLTSLGFLPVAAAGTAPDAELENPDSLLVPGAAVGVALVDGDVRLSGIGTLTWRQGNRILAFGHPMLQAGSVEMPMIAGKIHAVMPSLVSSFKLFSPSRPIGTITEDRLAAIGGIIGPVPAMIPVSVQITSPAINQNYNYTVVRHPALAGELTAIGLADILLSTEGLYEEMTLFSEMKLTIEDTTFLTIRHCFAGAGPVAELYRRASQELTQIFRNRFREVSVSRIDFKLKLTRGQNRLQLISCRPSRAVVRPGEEIKLTVVRRDISSSYDTKEYTITIPASAPTGTLTLVVASRESLNYWERYSSPSQEPQSLSALWRYLESTGQENELLIAAYTTAPGLAIADSKLPAPPPTVRQLLENTSTDETVVRTGRSKLLEKSFLLDHQILGLCELTLEVRR